MYRGFSVKKKRKRALIVAVIVAACVCVFLLIAIVLVKTPSIEHFQDREVPQSTKIYDQTGTILLWEIHGEERRTIVHFDKISRHIKNATIAIEDRSFYTHRGVRFFSLLRVLFLNALEGKKIGSGGSTITQQLVKNTLLTPEKTITRKLKEIIIALKIEATYSKDDILSLYLNEIPYGSNAYGVESAAETYFGSTAEDLTMAEAAYLAALPKAPSYYSPYGNHRDELENRKNLVLTEMLAMGTINETEFKQAKSEKVQFQPQKRGGIRAPHFVMYVRELLTEKYGEDLVERGGLTIKTTLDARLQQKGEEILTLRGEDNKKNFKAANAGFIAIEPKTGRILAMIGSRDYFDIANEGNFNVTLAKRQPGSAFKPIVYATAFKKGYTPETVVFDLETNFSVSNTPYIPHNYDLKSRGPVTLRDALAQSLNVPSVKVLYLAGIQDSIETARDLGITTLTDASRYGLTLVLGGGEVTLLELSGAYGVFANQGVRADTHAILEVKDKNGNVLEQEKNNQRNILDANIANTITSILTDNNARAPIFGPRSPLYFESGAVAVKTGTTNDFRDAWTIGYSPNIVVGAWAGNNDNSPMTKNVAGFILAPTWREFMEAAIADRERETFTQPAKIAVSKPALRGIWRGSRSYTIDKISGKLATEFTPLEQREERIIQQVHSILYWVSKDNPDGPIPDHPEEDPQFKNWEAGVRTWALRMNYTDNSSQIPITEIDTSHSPENWPTIDLPQQEQQIIIKQGETTVIHPTIQGKYPISQVEVFVDDEFVTSDTGVINLISLNTSTLRLEVGDHSIKIKVYDSIGNRQEKSFSFTVVVP